MASAPQYTRKSFVIAGVAMGVMLILGSLVVGFNYKGSDKPMGDAQSATIVTDPETGEVLAVTERPSSIPDPTKGKAPEDSGDPGGWEQLALFGLIAAGMIFIAAVVAIGGRKAKANRSAWRAAAEPGQEELRRAAIETEVEETVIAGSSRGSEEP